MPRPPCELRCEAIDLDEHLENARQHFGRNAGASVLHANYDFRAFAPRYQGNLATGRRVLGGVVQQIRQHLRQTGWIGIEPHGVVGQRYLDRVTRGVDQAAGRLDRARNDGGQLDSLCCAARSSRP